MAGVIVNTATTRPLLTVTAERAGAQEIFRRFVRHDGARCGVGDRPLGVCRVRSVAAGELVPVDVLGIVLVEAGAAIALVEGAQAVEADAQGRAIKPARNSSNPVAGYVLAAASAAGETVPVLLTP